MFEINIYPDTYGPNTDDPNINGPKYDFQTARPQGINIPPVWLDSDGKSSAYEFPVVTELTELESSDNEGILKQSIRIVQRDEDFYYVLECGRRLFQNGVDKFIKSRVEEIPTGMAIEQYIQKVDFAASRSFTSIFTMEDGRNKVPFLLTQHTDEHLSDVQVISTPCRVRDGGSNLISIAQSTSDESFYKKIAKALQRGEDYLSFTSTIEKDGNSTQYTAAIPVQIELQFIEYLYEYLDQVDLPNEGETLLTPNDLGFEIFFGSDFEEFSREEN